MHSFLFQTPALLISAILFLLMISFNWFGFYVRQRELKLRPDNTIEGLGPVEGSLLGLLALLLSFTFSLAASKNDTRRGIIVEEANNISTAILRCDMYPDSVGSTLRKEFSSYVDARIAYYDAGIDEEKLSNNLQLGNTYSAKIWSIIMRLSQQPENVLRSQQMIPALNAMMDITTTRDAERNAHVPESILWMLFLLTLAGSFITGYGSKSKRFSKIIVGCFALMTVMTIYLILDLDRPRRGIINMDKTHEKIIELKELLK